MINIETLISSIVCIIFVIMFTMIVGDIVAAYIDRRKERKLIKSGGNDESQDKL